MTKGRQQGFTLYELLITMLVIGVILSIGVPNLSDFTRNSRVTGATNDLHGSFLLARSEAARARDNVTICASANSTACGGTFDDGWIVFVDLDADGAADGGEEHILKVFPPVPAQVDINTNRTFFSFTAAGLGDSGTAFIAMICDQRGNTVAPGGKSAARRIVVTPIGRSTILRSQSTIATSVGSSGTGCGT